MSVQQNNTMDRSGNKRVHCEDNEITQPLKRMHYGDETISLSNIPPGRKKSDPVQHSENTPEIRHFEDGTLYLYYGSTLSKELFPAHSVGITATPDSSENVAKPMKEAELNGDPGDKKRATIELVHTDAGSDLVRNCDTTCRGRTVYVVDADAKAQRSATMHAHLWGLGYRKSQKKMNRSIRKFFSDEIKAGTVQETLPARTHHWKGFATATPDSSENVAKPMKEAELNGDPGDKKRATIELVHTDAGSELVRNCDTTCRGRTVYAVDADAKAQSSATMHAHLRGLGYRETQKKMNRWFREFFSDEIKAGRVQEKRPQGIHHWKGFARHRQAAMPSVEHASAKNPIS